MKCIEVERNLLDYLENEIESYELNAAMEVHISSCSSCKELYHSKKKLIDELKAESRPASVELGTRKLEVMKSIRTQGDFYSKARSRKLRFHITRNAFSYFMSTAAVIIAVFILSNAYFNRGLNWVFNRGGNVNSVDEPANTGDSKFAGIVTKPGETDPNSSIHKGLNGFEIYKVKDTDFNDAINKPLKELVLEQMPILTDKDIVSYNWTTHTMKLNEGVLDARFDMKGMPFIMPFVVVVQGQRIFLGAFVNPLSSAGFPKTPYIDLIPNSENLMTFKNYGTGGNRENFELINIFSNLNKFTQDMPVEIEIGKIKESDSSDFSYINIEKAQVLTNKDDLNLFTKTILAKRTNEEGYQGQGLPKYRATMKYNTVDGVKTKTYYFTPGADCYYVDTADMRGAYVIKDFNAGVISEMMKKLFGTEDIKKAVEIEPQSGGLTAAQITEKYIPHPFSPNIFENIMKFPAKWKGNVMPGFDQEMKSQGWTMYDAMGGRQYYIRVIDGKEVKISTTVKEAGGPTEAEAVTIITVEVVK